VSGGYGVPLIDRVITNRNVHTLEAMLESDYDTRGGNTPLFDSVGELVTLFKGVPDYNDPDVCFLIMATTDGEDNASPRWKSSIAREMRDLQATDRWTFVYRVPAGYESTLARFGVHPGNIAPWEQNEVGLRQAQVATTSAISNFYTARRTTGIRSSSTFYTDVASVPKQQVEASMTDVSSEVKIEENDIGDGIRIDDFCRARFRTYRLGTAFYELVKRESKVQDHKLLCVRDRAAGRVYSGRAARQLLGLPGAGTIALKPGQQGDYEIFVQSQSVNRKIPLRSKVLVWQSARVM
jgi:hypothetical protein